MTVATTWSFVGRWKPPASNSSMRMEVVPAYACGKGKEKSLVVPIIAP
jgi:hypothetical protein